MDDERMSTNDFLLWLVLGLIIGMPVVVVLIASMGH